ncbi:DUF5916 domain-containing protein [Steroidobacter sp.]|uniref:DUF5916 domain-containing protein n=1 Tax=Steroidobacter sp. TaxID=1978227 RepID=UPI001A3EB0DC|nr:DUF5916 domain-containing protein [Steroidobacter sp.]MBL8268861.1 hypothetical protein [Steroidobacter sp.]
MRTAPLLTRAAPRTAIAPILCALLLACVALFSVTAHAELVIDGRLDEPEWQNAVSCSDWQRTLPFARDEPRYGNELHILSTERGLAAAFILDQPPSERRIKPRTPRDSERLIGDTVSLMVDFDANAQIGYEFTIGLGGGIRDGLITNQNKFDRDWDGAWQHAVYETEQQWFVELFIPWSSISMRESRDETRTIGVYGTRYLFERGERYSCPGITSEAAVFLSDFQRMEISQHASVASLDIVPYGTVISDFLNESTRLKAGADINWKASPNLWLSATLNPDFGQVESDELVVDFSAIETVFTDKRPFFTENQGIFDLRTPANGQLVYTRRIGAATDDELHASSDIDAALKLTGTAGQVVYGGFVAQEDNYRNGPGRLFAATRVALPMEHARIGYLGTWVDRPFLDRDALVNALDYELATSDDWRISGQVIRSDIGSSDTDISNELAVRGSDVRRVEADTHGYESWLQVDFNRSSPLMHTLKLLYIDDTFDMNDLGYMERNALKQVEWETNHRVASDGGRVSGETQKLYTFYRENTDGQRLQSRLALSRDVSYASKWKAFQELRYVTSGVDDLLSRGNGTVRLKDRMSAYMDITTPRYGDWQFTLGSHVFQQGVEGYSGWMQFLAAWYPTEKLTLRFDLLPQYSADWLLWQDANSFGSFRAKRLDYDFRLDWIPAPRHELRIKWQWIGIDAELRRAYRTDAAGNLLPSTDPILPFTVNNLGLQVRYRYEMGPMSELFLVYARGGYNFIDADERGVNELFRDMTDVRDADQFLIKVRYKL